MEINIGKTIREKRLAAGFTVEQLAERIGKNRATVYRYESQDIENLPYSVLVPLAKALGCTPGELLSESNSQATMSREELELLRKYRALSPDHQQALLAMLDTLYDLDNKKDGVASA